MKKGMIVVLVLTLFLVSNVSAACLISNAFWNESSVTEGVAVLMKFAFRGNCKNEQFNYSIYEYDPGSLAPDDFVTSFVSSATSQIWQATYEDESGADILPQYYFIASVVGGSGVQSDEPKLNVTRVENQSGDINGNGFVDAIDLSVVIFNQGRSSGNPQYARLDLNRDGIIDWMDVEIVRGRMQGAN